MRYVVAMIVGVIVYALVLLAMAELLHIDGESQWYSLPFVASIVGLLAVVFMWRARNGGRRVFAVVAILISALVVLAIDIMSAVWYSCARGVCL